MGGRHHPRLDRQAAAVLRQDAQGGQRPDIGGARGATGKAVTLGQYLDDWLEDSMRPRLAPKTVMSYEFAVRNIKDVLGKVKLEKLTPEDVDRMLRVKSGNLSGNSPKHLRTVLGTALNRALKRGHVGRNVAALSDTVDVKPTRESVILEPEEVMALFDAMRTDPLLDGLVTVTLALALREGEALGLQWGDLDQAKGEIHIRRQLQRVRRPNPGDGPKTELVLRDLKTDTDEAKKDLPVPAFVTDALVRHRARVFGQALPTS